MLWISNDFSLKFTTNIITVHELLGEVSYDENGENKVNMVTASRVHNNCSSVISVIFRIDNCFCLSLI
jgi:hypothetical protein